MNTLLISRMSNAYIVMFANVRSMFAPKKEHRFKNLIHPKKTFNHYNKKNHTHYHQKKKKKKKKHNIQTCITINETIVQRKANINDRFIFASALNYHLTFPRNLPLRLLEVPAKGLHC
jgi:hypothetical protein